MAIDVRLDGLAVGYRRGKEVASDISVIFRGGELSCLIGPNGTGKSTLLKTISGFLEPKSGSVWFDDGEGDRTFRNVPPRLGPHGKHCADEGSRCAEPNS